MLNKLVIHLKNIIFFKIIIYLLVLIGLFILISVFQNDLSLSFARKQKSIQFLKEAEVKLDSIKEFEHNIAETNERYEKLTQLFNKINCIERNEIINKIEQLTIKYNLSSPIKVKMIEIYDPATKVKKSGLVKIRDYDVIINFNVADEASFLKLSQNIFSLMPNGSIITSVKMVKLQTLSPKLVTKLSQNHSLDLIQVKIKLLLRDIIYEK
ncbi:MAG: hypothetical protein HRU35_03645 [Rickettsiaceae bacterium]|nr:hypothetical protein [Rickettsiaceae bacterium]